jgi:hypothetical protein
MGLDTKTYWLTDRQSQCDCDFDLFETVELEVPACQDARMGIELRNWGFGIIKCRSVQTWKSASGRLSVWFEDFMCGVLQWYLECDIYSSCVKIRCQETDSENVVKE